jgi:hypothetical protein
VRFLQADNLAGSLAHLRARSADATCYVAAVRT